MWRSTSCRTPSPRTREFVEAGTDAVIRGYPLDASASIPRWPHHRQIRRRALQDARQGKTADVVIDF